MRFGSVFNIRRRAAATVAVLAGALAFAVPASAMPAFSGVATVDAANGATVENVELLPDGSSLVVGRFAGAVDFGSTRLVSAKDAGDVYFSADAYVAKRNTDGTWAWARVLLATSADDETTAVAVTTDGAIVATSLSGGGNARATRLSGDGTVQWIAPIRSDSGYGIATIDVARVDAGAVLVSGDGAGNFTFDSTTGTDPAVGAEDAHGFVARLDASGNFGWVTHVAHTAPDPDYSLNVHGIAGRGDGSSIVTVSVAGGGTSVGGTVLTNWQTDYADGFLVRLDGDGAVTSATRVSTQGGAVRLNDVAITPAGDAVVVGTTSAGTVHFGDEDSTDDVVLEKTGAAFVALQRADGRYAWANASTGVSEFRAVAVRPDGSSVVVGWTASGSQFPAGGGAFIDGPTFSLGVGAAIALGVTPGGAFGWAAAGTAVTVIPDNVSGSPVMEAVGVGALADGSVRVAGFIDGYEVVTAAFGTETVSPLAAVFTGFAGQLLDVPSAPAAPTGVSAGADRITVSVTPHAGPSVTRYEVTASPGGATCPIVPPATSCTITGLTEGTAYTFTAVATNAEGDSPASAASDPVTPSAADASTTLPEVTPAATGVQSRPAIAATVRSIPLSLLVTPRGWVRVSFAAVAGATRYRISAARSGRAARVRVGSCSSSARRVWCSLRLTPGRWTVRAIASSQTRLLARATRSVTVEARPGPLADGVTG